MARSKIAACILFLLVLPSCHSVLPAETVKGQTADRGAPLPYPAFNAALEKEYIAVAHRKLDDADYERVDLFIRKSLAAGTGLAVMPENPEDWPLPDTLAAELNTARQQLLRALERGARARAPSEAAHTQVMYDCWIDQQDGTDASRSADDTELCRQNFWGALALIELVTAPEPERQPAPAPGPPPEMMTRVYLVYIPSDGSAP